MTSKSSRLNWRQGFFRLWIFGLTLFVIAVAVISYGEIKSQFDAVALMKMTESGEIERLVPALCGQARGVAGIDFATTQTRKLGPWDRYAEPNPSENCWYALSKFRPLYPEYNDLSNKELSLKAHAKLGISISNLSNPWMTLLTRASIAVSIPLIVLLLGAALAWVISGFKTSIVQL